MGECRVGATRLARTHFLHVFCPTTDRSKHDDAVSKGAVRYPLRYVLDTMRRYTFTSLPRAQDTGGENPYIGPNDVSKLLIVVIQPSGC